MLSIYVAIQVRHFRFESLSLIALLSKYILYLVKHTKSNSIDTDVYFRPQYGVPV